MVRPGSEDRLVANFTWAAEVRRSLTLRGRELGPGGRRELAAIRFSWDEALDSHPGV